LDSGVKPGLAAVHFGRSMDGTVCRLYRYPRWRTEPSFSAIVAQVLRLPFAKCAVFACTRAARKCIFREISGHALSKTLTGPETQRTNAPLAPKNSLQFRKKRAYMRCSHHCEHTKIATKNHDPMNTAAPITLGGRIREERMKLGLSMRALAQRAGLKSVAFVADLEKGFRHPSPDVLENFAIALNLPVAALRELDCRAPVQEIRDITEKNPEWAMAFRRMVDAANDGAVTPGNVIQFVANSEKHRG
jgi:transcriptional regulator with XRE-family HTH domain